MLIRRAELEGRGPVDLRIDGARIAAIGAGLRRHRGESELDAAGAALLPGLHDHHVHLLALAAALESVPCGPPEVRDAAGLARALCRAEPAAGWIRGTGYHESVAGTLDRRTLDALAPPLPVRVQHRSGAAWLLNSAAVAALGLDAGVDAPGVERDARGRATGRLFDLDAWLRGRLPAAAAPELSRVGRLLARFGVTGATDATPTNGTEELGILRSAVASGALPQRLRLMGAAGLPDPGDARIARGPLKLMLHESRLAPFDLLEAQLRAARAGGRGVAFHCVTRAEVLLAAALLSRVGPHPEDRLEHASVAPPEVVERLAALPVRVVTQPGFLYSRGDRYAVDVEPEERPWLYRGRGFLAAGIALAAGSDAPFGDPDPWQAMRAAVERTSAGGRRLGRGECLSPEEALALFTSPAEAPGAVPRRLRVGGDADLCLLDRPWREARRALSGDRVAATFGAGRILWRAAA